MDLAELSVRCFTETVGSDAPAPGGGSVAALEASLGAGLTAMVACLTQGRKNYADYAKNAAYVQAHAEDLQKRLLALMDEDSKAFNQVSAAFALPRESDAEKTLRSAAIQEGLKTCTRTPMEMMRLCEKAISLARDFLESGFNLSSASDLGVAFLSLQSAMQGAWLNVLINLSSIKDPAFVREYREEGEAILKRSLPLAGKGYAKVLDLVQA